MILQVLIGAITSKGRLQVVYARGVASELGDGYLPREMKMNNLTRWKSILPWRGFVNMLKTWGYPIQRCTVTSRTKRTYKWINGFVTCPKTECPIRMWAWGNLPVIWKKESWRAKPSWCALQWEPREKVPWAVYEPTKAIPVEHEGTLREQSPMPPVLKIPWPLASDATL